MIVSCISQQEIIPTITAPSQKELPETTETPYPIGVETLMAISTYLPERIEVIQGLWALDSERLQFIRSRVSFVLPEDWDIINITSQIDQTNNLETHTVFRKPIENDIPSISFIFENAPVGMDSLEYFTNNVANNNLCKIDDVFQKGNGVLNLDAAIGYKCSYVKENVQHTMYKIYLTSNFGYETTGVQIVMDSPKDIFNQVDPEFVKFMQSLSITY